MKKKALFLSLLLAGAAMFLLSCLSYGIRSGSFRYKISEEGAVITDYFGEGNLLEFPEIIDGYNVVGIHLPEENTYSKQQVYYIIIPTMVKSIYSNSFNSFRNLRKITINGNADEIKYLPNLSGVLFEYKIPRKSESLLYSNTNNRVILVTHTSLWMNGWDVDGEAFSITNNGITILEAVKENRKPTFEIIQIIGDDVIYKIERNRSETLFFNENPLSNEIMEKIYEEALSHNGIEKIVEYINLYKGLGNEYFNGDSYAEIGRRLVNTSSPFIKLQYIGRQYRFDINALYFCEYLRVQRRIDINLIADAASYLSINPPVVTAMTYNDSTIVIRTSDDIKAGIFNAYLRYTGTSTVRMNDGSTRDLPTFSMIYNFEYY
jgi:hypothetical protein